MNGQVPESAIPRPSLLDAPDREAAAERLARRFEQTFGYRPEGVWSSPGRVNLIGEHVDYTAGLCLPTALPHRTFVATARRTDGVIRLRSAQETTTWESTYADARPLQVAGWPAYVAGVLWSLGEHFGLGDLVSGGFDVAVDGYVPYGSGLSSSAALECAVAFAVAELAGADLTDPVESDAARARLAEACMLTENVFVGAPTGGLDQSASLRCRADAVMLLDCQDGTTSHVPFDLDASRLTLLAIDTRASHSHADGEYGSRRASLAAACEVLHVPDIRTLVDSGVDDLDSRLTDTTMRRRARHAYSEITRVRQTVELLEAGRVADIGPLLDESHRSLRDDYEVSSTELDLAVDAARRAGALGARMTGGGFGGSALALVTQDAAESVAADVDAAFRSAGLRAPQFLEAPPSAGSGRDI